MALGLGEHVAGHLSCSTIRLNDGSGCQLKFQPTYFSPCRFHISNVSHEVLVLFTCQLCNFERRHGLHEDEKKKL